jgi:hypothetical protein
LRKIRSEVDEIFHIEYFVKIGGPAGWLAGWLAGWVAGWSLMNIIPLFGPSFDPFGIG